MSDIPDTGDAQSAWAVVQDMLAAYGARDLDAVLDYFSDDPDLVCIGSGPNEKNQGKHALAAHLEADFAEAQSMAVEFPWHHVAVRGANAWVAADCAFTMEADYGLFCVKARFTAALERQDGGWKLIQTHLSLPFPREDES